MIENPTAEKLTAEQQAMADLVAQREEFLAFVRRRVPEDDAEDLLQDAFVRSNARITQLRRGESAVAWFYRILRRAVADRQRRKRRQRTDGRNPANVAASAELVAPETTATSHCACLLRVVDSLNPGYAAALRAVDMNGTSMADYARSADLSLSNAGVRLHRARAALRRAVLETCRTCAPAGCSDCACPAVPNYA